MGQLGSQPGNGAAEGRLSNSVQPPAACPAQCAGTPCPAVNAQPAAQAPPPQAKEKSLDRKLAILRRNPDADVFILADAKDADMAYGIGSPGRSHTGELRFRSIQEYRDIIREIVRQELVDIMLMSASTNAVLTIQERIFDNSSVTPAARANDTTDIFAVRGGRYVSYPSMPFRTATLDHIQCGHIDCAPEERHLGANLGLYSVTFNNDPERDRQTLEEYNRFRIEAERKGFRHFLEVFDPNVPEAVEPELLPKFVNDMIVRTLAGVPEAGRPLFLKIVYHGPAALEELRRYDSQLIVGILGGSAGTTYDAFKMLEEARKYGAKVALYGRKINNAENQFLFIRFLRLIADGQISAEEAVRAYHAALERLGVRPHRTLDEDLQLTNPAMSYAAATRTVGSPSVANAPPERTNSEERQEPADHTAQGTSGDGSKPRKGASEATDSNSPADSETPPAGQLQPRPTSAAPNANPATNQDGLAGRYVFTPQPPGSEPDFSQMSPAEKLAYNKARLDRIFG